MKGALQLFALAALLAAVAACGTSMRVAQKNLEEGRLVPEAALATADFLNEYRHPLAPPRHDPAGLEIALERRGVPAQGGKSLVQIGISTAQPALRPLNVHALVFAPANPGAGERRHLTQALSAIRPHASELLHARPEGNLKDFLTRFVRQSFDGDEHHVILLAGSYQGLLDLPGLTERERQDIVDLGRVLAAKSVTLSILSIGEKPDFGFLRQLAQAAGGTFSVATESLDYEAWIKEDLRARNAETFTEVELVLQAKNGARIARVLAPHDLRHTDSNLAHTVRELKQGQQRVLLAELEVPASNQNRTNDVLEVELKYYVPSAKRYYQTRETVAILHLDDPNLALRHANEAIERSLLILRTQETLHSVARELRNRRNYQAIALLTGQSRALKRAGGARNDPELARDAAILAQYAERLYDFDGEWLKSVKIWKDLSWDTDRFRNVYQ